MNNTKTIYKVETDDLYDAQTLVNASKYRNILFELKNNMRKRILWELESKDNNGKKLDAFEAAHYVMDEVYNIINNGLNDEL